MNHVSILDDIHHRQFEMIEFLLINTMQIKELATYQVTISSIQTAYFFFFFFASKVNCFAS